VGAPAAMGREGVVCLYASRAYPSEQGCLCACACAQAAARRSVTWLEPRAGRRLSRALRGAFRAGCYGETPCCPRLRVSAELEMRSSVPRVCHAGPRRLARRSAHGDRRTRDERLRRSEEAAWAWRGGERGLHCTLGLVHQGARGLQDWPMLRDAVGTQRSRRGRRARRSGLLPGS
jgi:hypothetical protein